MAEPTSIMHEITDPDGNTVARIFSTTGIPQTKQSFAKALDYYQKHNQTAPEGYTVLEPGMTSLLRQGFEAVNQPVQQAAGPGLDDPNARINMLPPALAAPIKQLLFRLPAENVNTPGKAGLAGGIAAAAPFLGPVTGTGLLPKALPLAGNMLKSAAFGAGGGALARAATGESITPGNVAADASIAAMAGGITGLTDHFLTSYLSKDRGEQVARNIFNDILEKYPNLKNDPNRLDIIAGSGKEGLQIITQRGIEGLRGEVDDIAKGLTKGVVDIANLHAPGSISVGQQNTLRAMGRELVEHGNKALDDINDPKAYAAAEQAMIEQAMNIKTYLGEQLTKMGMKDQVAVLSQVDKLLQQQTQALGQFRDGAKVLAALKESGAAEGWNAARFNDVIAGRYRQEPGSLMEQVGKQLGMNTPLTKGRDIPAPAQEAAQTLLGLVKDRIPILKHFPIGGRPAPTTFPWQQPQGTLTPLQKAGIGSAVNAAVQSKNEALRSFVGE